MRPLAPVPSRLRRALLVWPVTTVVLQVLSGLGHGLEAAMDVTGSFSLAVLTFVAIAGVIGLLVLATGAWRAKAVLLRVFVGAGAAACGAVGLAAVLLVVVRSGAAGSSLSLAGVGHVLEVAGLAFIVAGSAWGLWCAANVLWDDGGRRA